MAAMEAARPDGIEAVAITTPNDSHYDAACCFIAAGIDVFCEKPLTTTLHDAVDLVQRVRQAGVTFAVAHAYAAHATIRQAKALVQSGELGRIRQVHVEFAQEWMMNESIARLKHVRWRQDPSRSGQTACTADIGTHAHHLACFVTGMAMTRLRAELLVCGAPKELDDTVYVSARYADDVPGLLWASQVAPGNFVGLRLRIFGEEAGLAWDQQNPECLMFSRLGNPAQVFRRGFGSGNSDAVERMTRLPAGNAEGWLEAWSSLYAEFAVAVWARRAGQILPSGLLHYATVEDGARGMKFVDSVVESNAAGGSWVDCTLPL
jgi:predicted dehydrogenase